ncbi:MAG: S1C family serine protease [candidate division KSB1 bacterium]|nr:S1C family serine protease [candidate division KSB1 bacterium]MDZ7317908.1 S1C family serine protease [candidate division KSB1 bacterium]MDZ7339884.1 S1C family serine protease [candidate division KSB1 bacterium]
MKKLLIFVFIAIINVANWVSPTFSQNASLLEKLQAEISALIDFTKLSVVTVSAKSSHSYLVDRDEGLLSFLKDSRQEKKDNLWTIGSGIIYNADGYIITRGSILAEFESIRVTLWDGRECDAEYIGIDENTGLAVLKIAAENIKPATFGDSDRVSLYSLVMVLGNSMGISPFASFGLINGYTADGIFIFSAPVNPGNIGGPVFNLKGEIIGIVTAQLETDAAALAPKYLDYGRQTGLALPMNQVWQMVNEVIQMHREQKGWLGVEFDPDSIRNNSLVVKDVKAGSPAARVGLKKGDRLLQFNESDLATIEVARTLIEQTKPGTHVSINFIRDNRQLKVFPCIEKKWPLGFNAQKPHHLSSRPAGQTSEATPPYPIILSPARFQQMNSRMIQMENEIRSLKNQLQQASPKLP